MGGKMGRMERGDVNDRITLLHESINSILVGDVHEMLSPRSRNGVDAHDLVSMQELASNAPN
jgi:hypothetical protein